ncbi:MAG TPA: DNA-3-methyladenine glycosylase 2 family protein [Mycobacteriales bacterium]|nr:DNA-3-methyladenine glycosylase 2 family protein [Mycobacteriales bacterium]
MTTTIVPRGPFSLRELATFGFGQRLDTSYDGVLRMAFCADGYAAAAGVEVRQDPAGVHIEVHGDVSADAVTAQVARILSLDHDGERFLEVGQRDPVIGRLQEAAPGLRPPQFHSPYEAAAWAVLSARRPAREMARVRAALSAAYGTEFRLAGQRLHAFPRPSALLDVSSFPGIPEVKLARLHAVAQAAWDGRLDATRLAAMDPAVAMASVRELPGIGPFYAALIVVRACGLADVLVPNEAIAMDTIADLYGLDGPPSLTELERIAEPWRPFRTWATVLLRAAASRLPARTPSPA